MGKKRMEDTWRGGPWYVVDFRRMEFLTKTSRLTRETATAKTHWTARMCWARAYKTPSAAVMICNIINAQRGRHDCQALGKAAAMCVDAINRRDGLPVRGNREQGTGNREQGTGNRGDDPIRQHCALPPTPEGEGYRVVIR